MKERKEKKQRRKKFLWKSKKPLELVQDKMPLDLLVLFYLL